MMNHLPLASEMQLEGPFLFQQRGRKLPRSWSTNRPPQILKRPTNADFSSPLLPTFSVIILIPSRIASSSELSCSPHTAARDHCYSSSFARHDVFIPWGRSGPRILLFGGAKCPDERQHNR